MIVKTITDLIGNTPMLEIPPELTGLQNIDLYAKLEHLNPFGSLKDRTAWGMIKDDLDMLKKDNRTIYENSSGNTAKSLAAIAGIHGLKFKLVAALSKVEEQKHVMQIQDAEIQEIAVASDCFDPSDPNDPQFLIERTASANPNSVYFPSQFTNSKNPAFHEATTAREILDDIDTVDYFFAGLGTSGSSMGITNVFRQHNPDFTSIGITARANDFIPGIRAMGQLWETGLFRKDVYNDMVSLSSMEALDGMLELNRKCGILCGPSSGANYTAALDYLRKIDGTLTTRKKAVFLINDRMEWYISYVRERMPEIFGDRAKENAIQHFDSETASPAPAISADDLDQWLAQHPDALIVDIRSSDSFKMLTIPNSMNMPVEMFEKWIDNNNPFPSDKPVVLVCAIGERSRHYAAYLRTMNCNAYNLDGGIMAWYDDCKIAA